MSFGFLVGFVIVAGILVGLYLLRRSAQHQVLVSSFNKELFLIRVPKEVPAKDISKDSFKREITQFEELLSNLVSLKQPFVFEMAVPHVGEEIHFYLAVPRGLGEIAVKQIHGLWQHAHIEAEPDDYNVFNAQGVTVAAYLKQQENFALPIRTYHDIESDSFSSIVAGFNKVNDVGEGAALQLVIRPAPHKAKRHVQSRLRMLKKGHSLNEVFGHEFLLKPSGFRHAVAEHVLRPEEETKGQKERILEEDAIKALQEKVAKPLFEVNVRLVASADSQRQADNILDSLAAGFSQFAAPNRNELRTVAQRQSKKLVHEFIFRNFDSSKAMTLNSTEIASLYHLPTPYLEAPRVKWLKAKEAEPPVSLPRSGVLLGQSIFRGEVRPVHITDDDRRRHIYLVGQTGTGKSTLMANMIIDDIEKGKGIGLIDPHGDLVEAVLGHVPEERSNDVIYFDATGYWRPLGLNMLDYNLERPEEKTFIVNEMQGIFNKLFPPETMGPMFEQYMRNALLLLMEDMKNEPATLVEVPRVFTDVEYRKRKLGRIYNPTVLDFWEKEAAKAGGEASLANMTPYITSKFNNFIANDYIRPIIGQTKSAFNFRQVMDEGKILLVNLAKGRIGDINAGLLGMILTGKILMAALSRVDLPEEKRRDFNVYIDEFQSFTTDSIASILSEARKYRLNLTMGHQFIAQLTEKIRDAAFGNVGSLVVFRVGVQDAEFLMKHFEPVFNQNDLINIDNFNAYVKVLINGETTKPFNVKTLPLEAGNHDLAEELKKHSAQQYGMDRQDIEANIYRRLRE